MNNKFNHIIITRFSVYIKYMITSKKNILFDDKRLNRRFSLFITFCYPSITKQVNKNFTWIILIDKNLPEKYKIKLKNIISEPNKNTGPIIKIIEWDPILYEFANINWIKKLYLEPNNISAKYLITTRLDDDDALYPYFTETIQSYINKCISNKWVINYRFITLPTGLVWMGGNGNKYGNLYTYQSNFIAIGLTLIVDINQYPMHIYAFNHSKINMVYLSRDRNYLNTRINNLTERKDNNKLYKNIKKFKLLKTTNYSFIYIIHDHNDSNFRKLTSYFIKNTYQNRILAHNVNKIKVFNNFNLNHNNIDTVNIKIWKKKI